MTKIQPVSSSRRLPVLDFTRGTALLGIMFVNMTWFTGFAILSADERSQFATAHLDAPIYWLIHVLVDAKFWSIFAFLFGVGVALQRSNRTDSERSFNAFYLRRIAILFAIGFTHASLLWFGDIVSLYAVAGLALIFLKRFSNRTLLVIAIVMLGAPIVQLAVHYLIFSLRPPSELTGDPGHGPAELLSAFATGSYVNALHANWEFLKERWIIALYDGRFFKLIGMFLLGFYAGSCHLFVDSIATRRIWKRVLTVGTIVGLPLSVVVQTHFGGIPLRPPSALGWLAESLKCICVPALSLAYVAGIILIYPRIGSRLPTQWIASAGRMSLTNYILQTAVGITIFYGCGFGKWGKIGITWAIVILVLLFVVQAIGSHYWLKRFRQGPLEWIWRCGTYGRLLPIQNSHQTVSHYPTDASVS